MENHFDPRPSAAAPAALPPGKDSADVRRTRQLALALFGLLIIAEGVVALAWSFLPGILLMGATAFLLVTVERLHRFVNAQRDDAFREFLDTYAEAFYRDAETELPNHKHLVEQLGREIARSDRYHYSLSIAVFQIVRVEDLAEAWGDAAVRRGISHVAQTLRRVCRTSDFLARVSPDKFAVVLVQCTEDQARMFGERVALAVANRPLKRDASLRVPLYVNVQFSALEFSSAEFRGPLEFLSAAGGDLSAAAPARKVRRATRAEVDPASLRRQLVEDYQTATDSKDFAEAYAEFKERRERRAG